MKTKIWYKSRTLWVNFIALFAMILQMQFGFILDAETQGAIIILLNVFLRFDSDSAIVIE